MRYRQIKFFLKASPKLSKTETKGTFGNDAGQFIIGSNSYLGFQEVK